MAAPLITENDNVTAILRTKHLTPANSLVVVNDVDDMIPNKYYALLMNDDGQYYNLGKYTGLSNDTVYQFSHARFTEEGMMNVSANIEHGFFTLYSYKPIKHKKSKRKSFKSGLKKSKSRRSAHRSSHSSSSNSNNNA